MASGEVGSLPPRPSMSDHVLPALAGCWDHRVRGSCLLLPETLAAWHRLADHDRTVRRMLGQQRWSQTSVPAGVGGDATRTVGGCLGEGTSLLSFSRRAAAGGEPLHSTREDQGPQGFSGGIFWQYPALGASGVSAYCLGPGAHCSHLQSGQGNGICFRGLKEWEPGMIHVNCSHHHAAMVFLVFVICCCCCCLRTCFLSGYSSVWWIE